MQVYTGFALHKFDECIPLNSELPGHQKGARTRVRSAAREGLRFI